MKRAGWALAGVIVLVGCSSTTPPATVAKEPTPPPSYFRVDAATAGVVKGSVKFTGRRPASTKIDMDSDPECSKMHGSKPVAEYSVAADKQGRLANTFIYLKTGMEGRVFEAPKTDVVIDQHGCWFEPRVLGAQTGQTLKVTNSDPVTHNIHPMAHTNREWNHSQGPGEGPLTRRFTKPEVMIPVKCNIHGWMHAFIGVLDHPYFAVSGTDGTFDFKNVPPGHYTIAAWQEKLGTQEQVIDLPPSGTANVVFTFRGE